LSISERLCQSDVVVIRAPKELKKRMKNARINWSKKIRAFIERRLRSYEPHNMLKVVRERSRGEKSLRGLHQAHPGGSRTMMILDASFIVKLFVEEPGSELAENYLDELLRSGEEITTVDIALAEYLNALWKHAKIAKDLEENDLREAVSDLLTFWSRLEIISTRDLASETTRLSLEDEVPIYDALYIAAAIKHRTGLATFDEKLRSVARKHGVLTHP
jgi:predicted nucleic acid-binding protein